MAQSESKKRLGGPQSEGSKVDDEVKKYLVLLKEYQNAVLAGISPLS